MQLLTDKYFKNYAELFKYNIVNKLLTIFLFTYYPKDKICIGGSHFMDKIYKDILNLKIQGNLYDSFNYQHIIVNKYINININININKNKNKNKYDTKPLIITNISSVLYRLDNFKYDVFLLPTNWKNINEIENKYKDNKHIDIIYSSHNINTYKDVIKQIKHKNLFNNKIKLISCHYGYITGLPLTASYKMLLQLPYVLSSLGIALHGLEKNGTLLLFWTIINVHVPSVQKILTLLAYSFENIQVVTDDINQNILQGITEYYIKCTGFKDNISDELINKLLDISFDIENYTYDICDILDYYEKYSKLNPNQTLFYKHSHNTSSRMRTSITKTKSLKNSLRMSELLKSSKKHSSTTKKTQKQSQQQSQRQSQKKAREIKYIEDFNLPGFDLIKEDADTQYKTMLLSNKLETIFIECFDKIIRLYRENTLDQAISYLQTIDTLRFHHSENKFDAYYELTKEFCDKYYPEIFRTIKMSNRNNEELKNLGVGLLLSYE